MFHLHAKAENTSKVYTLRMSTNFAAPRLYNLFGDEESKAIAHAIHLCCALQLTKPAEELRVLRGIDSFPCVYNLHRKAIIWSANIVCLYIYVTV